MLAADRLFDVFGTIIIEGFSVSGTDAEFGRDNSVFLDDSPSALPSVISDCPNPEVRRNKEVNAVIQCSNMHRVYQLRLTFFCLARLSLMRISSIASV